MKRNILYTLFIISFCLSKQISAQCDLPSGEPLNTGTNMAVFFSTEFVSSLSITSSNAYIVAFTQNELLIGSVPVDGGSIFQMVVWGDDATTSEIDGAASGEILIFKLVDDDFLYDIEFSTPISFTTNGFEFAELESKELVCEPTYCGDAWLPEFTGNTGLNMTVMLTDTFVLSLNVQSEDAYIVATTPSGLVVGSSNVAYEQTSLAVWADDSFTPEIDDASEGEEITLSLIDGTQMYSIDHTFNFVANAIQSITDWVSTEAVCEAKLPLGCTDSEACNYNASANTDDGSCTYVVQYYDCSGVCLIDSDGDGVCDELEVAGCMSDWAENYNQHATDDDASCYLNGCSSEWADNYDENVTVDDASCYKNGCTSDWAANYDPIATIDDASCVRLGCTASNADNFDDLATNDDESCLFTGCMDEASCTYDVLYNVNDSNLCSYPAELYNCEGDCISDVDNDGVCDGNEVVGCQEELACNYNADATDSSDSCTYLDGICESCEEGLIVDNDIDNDDVCNADELEGCTDSNACEGYNSSATEYDGSCLYMDDCGVCNGVNACAVFFESTVSVTVDDGLVEDLVAFENNFEDLIETQLALPEGVVDVLEVIIADRSRGDIDVQVVYTITLTQEELVASDFDSEDSTNALNQINNGINELVSGAESLFVGLEFISGCIDATACNYDVSANIESSCSYSHDLDVCASCSGEQDGTGVIVDNDADDDSVCNADEVDGCTNDAMFNYNVLATDDDSSCYPVIEGCMDEEAFNYDAPTEDVQSDVNTDDGSCYPVVYGCNDPIALNYNDLNDDGIGDDLIIDGEGVNVNTDDGSCVAYKLGCTNVNSCNYQENAVHNISLCDFPPVHYSCDTIEFTSETYVYEISCINDADADGVCDENEVEGCASSSIACNYNPDASDEVECVFADQFLDCSGNCLVDSDQDGVCDELEILGCIDNVACNYNENATEDDGVCEYAVENYNCDDTCVDDTDGDGICDLFEITGCTSD